MDADIVTLEQRNFIWLLLRLLYRSRQRNPFGFSALVGGCCIKQPRFPVYNSRNRHSVLGDDFKFYQNLKYLPLTSYPSNNQSALIIYCLGGKAKITVHEDVHWIQPEELIILLPGQFVSFSEPSEDFSTVTMVISTSLFSDALSGVPRFSPQ